MNFVFAGRLLLVLIMAALLAYGLHQYINAALGVPSSIFDTAWQPLALALGLSIAGGLLYPHARGVKRGDVMIAELARTRHSPQGVMAFVESSPVTALSDGRSGQKIRVLLPNGKSAEGIVIGYAGTFTPSLIRITETEV